MLNGRVINSERPGHTILEGEEDSREVECCLRCLSFRVQVPNPLGVVGVLSAFNFPVAVYGWYRILSH